MADVRLPGDAVDAELKDVSAPTVGVLRALFLLPSEEDLEEAGGPGAILGGPPQSVALIEAGATAFSKWWAGGAAATVAGVWVAVKGFYNENSKNPETQQVLLWGAAIVTAALVLAIAWVISSDVRGRAAASVATVNARASVAARVIEVAEGKTELAAAAATVIPLPDGRKVSFLSKPAADEENWLAIAIQAAPDAAEIKYLVVKESEMAWASADEVRFV